MKANTPELPCRDEHVCPDRDPERSSIAIPDEIIIRCARDVVNILCSDHCTDMNSTGAERGFP